MRWTYDRDVDCLYVNIRDGTSVRQRHLSDAVIVDYDEAGEVLGIEVIGARTVWSPDDVADAVGLSDNDRAGLVSIAQRGWWRLPPLGGTSGEPATVVGGVTEPGDETWEPANGVFAAAINGPWQVIVPMQPARDGIEMTAGGVITVKFDAQGHAIVI